MSTTFPPKGDSDKKLGAVFAPLSVSANDTPNLTVRIRPGSYFNSINEFVEFAGGVSPSIAAPATGNSWNIVALSNTGSVSVFAGVAGSSPAFPSVPAGYLPLAAVYMTATTSAIAPSNVVDIRPFVRTVDQIPNLSTELANRPTMTDLNNALALKADVGSVAVGPHSHVVADVTDYVSATTGMINAAVGAKANDADVVHLAGNETIAGDKTFSGNVSIKPSGFESISLFTTQTPTAGDAGVRVSRGANPPALLKWDETSQTWQAGTVGGGVDTILTAGNFGAKADKVAVATAGHFAGLDATGNLTDSGSKASDFATAAALSAHTGDVTTHFSVGSIVLAQSQVTNLVTDLAGKAASTHSHVIADVTGLQAAINDKADSTHAHVIADVTGLQGALDGKAADVHTHVVADITDFSTEVSNAIGAASIAQSQVTGLSTALGAKAPTADPVFTGVVVLPSYTLATLPAVVLGGAIIVTDANTGVGTIAFGTATDWIDVSTGVAVA
jgi:hypothetical protein